MSEYKVITVKVGLPGQRGETGPVYIPHMIAMDDDVQIVWSNDAGLPNPAPQSVLGKQGPQGEKGDSGIIWTPHTDDDGDHVWFWMSNDAGLPATIPIDIRGLQGPQGIQGHGFVLSGACDTYDDLIAAHPQGDEGAAYTVGTDDNNRTVYIWDIDALQWRDIGKLEGPQGPQGIEGKQGIQGVPGSPGADGKVQAIVAGENITVDNADPARPIVSASGGGGAEILPLDNVFTGVNTFDAPSQKPLMSTYDIVELPAILGVGWSKNGDSYSNDGSGYGQNNALSFKISDEALGKWIYIEWESSTIINFNIYLSPAPYNGGGYSIKSQPDSITKNVIKVQNTEPMYINICPNSNSSVQFKLLAAKVYTNTRAPHMWLSKNTPVRIDAANKIWIGSGGELATQDGLSIGNNALLKLNSGAGNVAIGNQAGMSLTEGSYNTLLGVSAGQSLISGSRNTLLGFSTYDYDATGNDNTCIGYRTGHSHIGCNQNTYIGSESKGQWLNGNNQTAIGYKAVCTASNQVTLGNDAITQLRCKVTSISSISDKRTKEEYHPADLSICYADVLRLPVHRFKYKDFTGTNLDEHKTGFMADDVEQVFPKCVHVTDQWFPVLDAAGNQVMEIVVDEETGEEHEQPKQFLMKDVKEIAVSDQALVTLWGAVQYLAAKVDALEAKQL